MSPATRRITAAATTAVAGLAIASGATAAPTKPSPTEEAREAGITEPGQASMGWRLQDEQMSSRSTASTPSGVPGVDVSSHQGNVDWGAQRANGKKFAYVKATESDSYTNPYFAQQYNGSYSAGMIRGAYHFAIPSSSGGTTQAEYFLRHGGGWSSDGKTLPGALDMEWNPYGATCYGKSQSQMRSWINSFLNRYKYRTGRYPAIYTNTTWWNECVGHDSSFARKSPLWIARYGSTAGNLPTGWDFHTFWQYTDQPIDQNVFNGAYYRLYWFAKS